MLVNYIDAKMLQKLFVAGAKRLEANKEYINELNVFPVPDGDTGTNMSLTILAAAKEVSNVEVVDMKTIAKAISSGSLRGARGNSGVILSQLFRGFSKEIAEYEEIDTTIMANAFQSGVETAYKAVMKPKEGTILTVAKAIAEKALQEAVDSDDVVYVLKASIEYGNEILEKTPDMLPVLKQAGVVDAGGQGLITILQGAYDVIIGKEDIYNIIEDNKVAKNIINNNDKQEQEIKFGYCTEFIIDVKNIDNKTENDLKIYLENIGDSIVVVSDEDLIKVHVHTNEPGNALQKALSVGSLTNIKIENMRVQHSEIVIKKQDVESVKVQKNKIEQPKEKKKVGFIAVSIGEGINEIFTGLGVDFLIEGGQTMNPSTEDMLNAIEQVNAENIFILPNNKNIILAAEQAKELEKDKKIFVIPTKTVPQGISAVINYDYNYSPSENADEILDIISKVKTGQLTFAVRDTKIDDKDINEGDILGIGNGKILVVGNDLEQSVKDLMENLVDENSELISIYYGEDVKEEEAGAIQEYFEETYEDCDVELHYGGQPLYYYIISVE